MQGGAREDWDAFRLLLAISRGRALARVAASLRVDASTVLRRLARAEAAHGARLAERIGGELRPTGAGARLVAAAERMEREVQAARAAVTGTDSAVAGLVRLTAVPILANRVLVPALPRLCAAHPALAVELQAEPRDLSLLGRETDIALRLARPAREMAARARRVGRLAYGGFVRRGAEAAAGGPLPWIGYAAAMQALPQSRWLARHCPPPAVLVSDAESMLAAALAGLGRALLPAAIGAAEPALCPVPLPAPAPERELWLITHPELAPLPRIRAAAAWIGETVAALAAPQAPQAAASSPPAG
ncbi:LysR family transcriptional regulator [Paralimibaculum aggregatum]|uniref:LysR family transcriptional regulator n=1 Tax=Paralimibaculum aggregatum TaxID=3036245 RepID=A0ABQ6LI49_9RHOB|nr:LysR family transcriptional regulator [Limibaculum sp. NKW23]GMG80863.1 LysR family transcriptional regulator [Limibaculum sp. NKW23]